MTVPATPFVAPVVGAHPAVGTTVLGVRHPPFVAHGAWWSCTCGCHHVVGRQGVITDVFGESEGDAVVVVSFEVSSPDGWPTLRAEVAYAASELTIVIDEVHHHAPEVLLEFGRQLGAKLQAQVDAASTAETGCIGCTGNGVRCCDLGADR